MKPMNEFERIAKAFSVCMPETQYESQLGCEQCPFCDACNGEDIITLPVPLGLAIRNYFSKNRVDSNIIQ